MKTTEFRPANRLRSEAHFETMKQKLARFTLPFAAFGVLVSCQPKNTVVKNPPARSQQEPATVRVTTPSHVEAPESQQGPDTVKVTAPSRVKAPESQQEPDAAVKRAIMAAAAKRVIIYSMPGCGPCNKAKKFLDAKKVKYEVRDLQNKKYQMECDALGQCQIPLIVIGNRIIVGYDEPAMEKALKIRKR